MLGLLVVVPALVSLQVCGPRITFSPTNLSFTPQVVDPNGTPSPAQVVTVRNSGNKPGTLGTISAVGPFAQTNHCPASLNPSASCTIDVSFLPNALGALNGAVVSGSRGATLTAVGLAPVGFNPSVLDFGTVDIGKTSAKSVTLTNNQTAALAINSITASGNYSQVNDCPTSLAAGASCTLNVSFVPAVKGTVAGALSVVTDAALAAQPVGLTGIGLGTATPNVSFTPASLDFGNLEAGTESAVKTVTLKNTSGSASLTVTSIAVSTGYASTDTCAGKIIPAGGTCTISVKFQPTANLVPVAYPGAITVVDSDPTATQVIALAGFGVAPVSPSPTSLDMGVIFYRSSSGPSTVTLTNSDAAAETPTLIGTPGVSLANSTCTGSLAPGGKCTVDVSLVPSFTGFGPPSAGPVHGAMAIDFSSGGFLSPQVVSVSGCRTEVARTPESLNFGAVPVGTVGDTETVTIGSGTFNFSGFTISGANAAEFAITNNTCGTTLSSGTCSVDLTFTPTAAGVRTATLEIADDQHCSPQPVNLAGGSAAGPFVVTAQLSGTGTGNVTSNPVGVSCGSQGTTCSANFASGKSVVVTPVADPDSHFVGWSGACTGTAACDLTMTADRQIVAAFDLNPSLTVTLSGNTSGTGTVTSNPPGINCPFPQGGACQAYFPKGTSVQLTESPGSGSVFDGWTGGCSGTGACTVTMNTDQNIGGGFTGPPTINIGIGGTGSGSVTSVPPGIDCPATACSFAFPSGTTVSLTATAASGSGFDGWNGACSGTGTCSFKPTADTSVGATFDLPDFNMSVTPSTTPTIAPGASTRFDVAIAGLGGFTTPVAVTCSSPTTQGVNCTLSAASVKPGSTVTLTVTTLGPSGALAPLPVMQPSGPLYAALISMPGLALVGLGCAGRRNRRKLALRLCVYSLLLLLVALELACGGSSGTKNSGTPPGTYTVSVNAAAGGVQHTIPVTVNVH
jgi:hypothetical protein